MLSIAQRLFQPLICFGSSGASSSSSRSSTRSAGDVISPYKLYDSYSSGTKKTCMYTSFGNMIGIRTTTLTIRAGYPCPPTLRVVSR
jgi:hypothetical protein